MSMMELVDKLSEEAILLEPGKLQSCGKMLTILEELEHPEVLDEKNRLKDYLEKMIMKDLDGCSVEVEDIVR